MMRLHDLGCLLGLMLLAAWGGAASAQDAPAPEVFEELPVREVTVFKDGHAFMLHSGSMPTNAEGNVEIDRLPRPVLGTFWAYGGEGTKLASVVSGRRRVSVERTALQLSDFLRANVGRRVRLVVGGEVRLGAVAGNETAETVEGRLLGFPTRSAAEQEATRVPGSDPGLAQVGNLMLIETADGTRVLPVGRVLDATLLGNTGEIKTRVADEEWRNVMTLRLDGAAKNGRADVGLVYVQLGIRWIPEYRVTLGEDGQAQVELQATLINELTDLKDVKAHLVVGVPTFKFKDQVDPISLEQAVARLSSNFRNDSQFLNFTNNAIMTQQMAMPVPRSTGSPDAIDLGPDVGGADSQRGEDLYLYDVDHLTLGKGERMTVHLASFSVPIEDVYTIAIPFATPPELVRNLSNDQQREMARLLARPRATHAVRLTNNSKYPLTTSPVLMMREERVLAQGMMTYTPIGAKVDLPITTAVGVQVDKNEEETGRQPNAMRMNGSDFTRVNLKGRITINNYRDKPTRLEIKRYVLGAVDTVGQDGVKMNGNVFDEQLMLDATNNMSWWNGYSWPWWWASVNGLGRVSWTVTLEPGATTTLDYAWHYFWA